MGIIKKLKALIEKLWALEFVRFLCAGAFNTAFNWGLFALLWLILKPEASLLMAAQASTLRFIGGHYYAVVTWIAWFLTVPVSTYTMRRFVFRHEGAYFRQVLRAYGVYLPAQLVSMGVLVFCVQVLKFHPLLGQLVAVCFSTVISYVGNKFFTFRASFS
ncbi:MAG: GtrA family protein [Coriobacteriia bacterium]|nr:GtrA family protein [Coriobacteriia bacterium]